MSEFPTLCVPLEQWPLAWWPLGLKTSGPSRQRPFRMWRRETRCSPKLSPPPPPRSFLIALLLTNSTLREYHVGNEQGETKTTRTFEYRDPERKEKKKKNKKKIESLVIDYWFEAQATEENRKKKTKFQHKIKIKQLVTMPIEWHTFCVSVRPISAPVHRVFACVRFVSLSAVQ